jgi:peptidoglycan/LPS O-acetylase OafA/YrhL
MTPTTRIPKLPSLDGWRAVSIALVLICHSTYTPGFPTVSKTLFDCCDAVGIWGVRFFFVISGFLITHLLIQEQAERGFISLKNFYARRALRILPVCYFYLFVLGFFTHYAQNATMWAANLTFTTNFFIILDPLPTRHLWSLGVEEQFYLLWPVLLGIFISRADDVSKLARILILPVIIAPTVRLLHYKQLYPAGWEFLFANSSFFARFDSLAYGCLAALWFNHGRLSLENLYRKHPGKIVVAGVLLIFSPWLLPFHGRFGATCFDSLQAIGFTFLLLQSLLLPERGFYRALNWRWVRHLGVLSYSIYIWQQMFCGTDAAVFGLTSAWWLRFPTWILTALLAAHASYYLLEKPLLKLRARLHTA